MLKKERCSKPTNFTEIAYLAGLFDGEGCVQYKQRMETKRRNRPRRYKCWMVTLEMSMTDEDAVRWFHKIIKVGTVRLHAKNKSPSSKPHWKNQWRWRCPHRDALKVANLLLPYARVKRKKLQQIINHYAQFPIRHTHDGDVHFHHSVSRHGHHLLK